MVAEENPFVGGLEIVAVAQALGRSGAPVVERQHARGQQLAVETVAGGIGASRGQHQPDAIDVFPAVEGDAAQAERRGRGEGGPEQMGQKFHASESTRSPAMRGEPRRGNPENFRSPRSSDMVALLVA